MVFICLADDPPPFEPSSRRRSPLPHAAPAEGCEGRLREHDHREGQLEARHGRTTASAITAPAPTRALPDLSRPARLRPPWTRTAPSSRVTAHVGEVRGGGAAVGVRHRPGAPVALRPHPAPRPGESYTMDGKAAVPTKRLSPALHGRRIAAHLPLSEHLEPLPGRPLDRLPRPADRPDRDRGLRPSGWSTRTRSRASTTTSRTADAGLDRDQRRGPAGGRGQPAGHQLAGLRPGPYSKIQEDGVIQFVDWYCRTLGDRLARRGAGGGVTR